MITYARDTEIRLSKRNCILVKRTGKYHVRCYKKDVPLGDHRLNKILEANQLNKLNKVFK